MPESEHVLCCPFCQGRGKMLRSEIVSQVADPDLPSRILTELAHSQQLAEHEPVLAGATKTEVEEDDYARKVHGWNRHLLWRRSSKE